MHNEFFKKLPIILPELEILETNDVINEKFLDTEESHIWESTLKNAACPEFSNAYFSGSKYDQFSGCITIAHLCDCETFVNDEN